MRVMHATMRRKFLFFINSLNSFLKSKGSSFFDAITLGGVGGRSLARKINGKARAVTIALMITRYRVNLYFISPGGLLVSSPNTKPGMMLAIKFPRAIALLKIVIAVTRYMINRCKFTSFSPNHWLVS